MSDNNEVLDNDLSSSSSTLRQQRRRHEEPDEGHVSSSSSSTSSMEEASNPQLVVQVCDVLLCAGCRRPVASSKEILANKEEKAWREHVYSYELDLFGNEESVWAYSATNPTANRFDLIRVAPIPLSQSPNDVKDGSSEGDKAASAPSVALVSLRGPYSPEHSFFVGYDWCFCSCSNCGHFLGWGFISHDKVSNGTKKTSKEVQVQGDQPKSNAAVDDGAEQSSSDHEHSSSEEDDISEDGLQIPDFLGIIVTHCTGASCSQMEFEAEVKSSAKRRERLQLIFRLRRELLQMISGIRDGYLEHRLLLEFDEMSQTVLSSDPAGEAEARSDARRAMHELMGTVRRISAHLAVSSDAETATPAPPSAAPGSGSSSSSSSDDEEEDEDSTSNSSSSSDVSHQTMLERLSTVISEAVNYMDIFPNTGGDEERFPESDVDEDSS